MIAPIPSPTNPADSVDLVSVVIPAHNAERTIADTLRSVVSQTWTDLEIIVVDDGSTDDTRAIVAAFDDSRIELISMPHAGASAARNMGIDRSTGATVAFLDADDQWHPTKIAKQMAAMERTGAAVAYSWVDRHDPDTGRRVPMQRQTAAGRVDDLLAVEFIVVTTSNLMVRRAVLDVVGRFDETIRQVEDWDLAVRLAQIADFVCVEEPLTHYFRGVTSRARDVRGLERDYRTVSASWPTTESDQHTRDAKLYRHMASLSAQGARTPAERVRGLRILGRHVYESVRSRRDSRTDPVSAEFVSACVRALVGGPSKRRPPAELSPRDQFEIRGQVVACGSLADPSVLGELIADERLFADTLDEFARRGQRRVPYLVTDAIRRVTFDANLAGYVESILGEEWVMWGANIRRGVPNQADCWHTDTESRYWQSLTVVVGLAGCHEHNATHVVPFTHRLDTLPPGDVPCAEAGTVIGAANWLHPLCETVETFDGFGNGRFYGFDAKAWHAGDARLADGRMLLFMHFQRARDRRVPNMRDYAKGTWMSEPAPYVSRRPGENTRVARPPRPGGGFWPTVLRNGRRVRRRLRRVSRVGRP